MSSLRRETLEEVGGATDLKIATPLKGKEGVQHFLSALGYQRGNSIYIRTLPPKDFEPEHYSIFPALTYKNKQGAILPAGKKFRMQGDRLFWVIKNGERAAGDAWETLQAENAKGFGVYVIPNPGGHTDAEITGSRVLFWEDDRRAKAEQLERFDQQNEEWGGGCYFVHDEFLDPDDFSIFQKRAIRAFDSDSSIWNPSRLMRLPGFDHTSIVDGAIVRAPVTIVRPWDGEVTKWAWIDNSLPQPTEEDIDSVLRSGKTTLSVLSRSLCLSTWGLPEWD
jgi:hypothetical protein